MTHQESKFSPDPQDPFDPHDEDFPEWIESLRVQIEDRSIRLRCYYVIGVAAIQQLVEARGIRTSNLLFRQVQEILAEEETLSVYGHPDVLVASAPNVVAQGWLLNHAVSPGARAVCMFGSTAVYQAHLEFMGEMFADFKANKKIAKTEKPSQKSIWERIVERREAGTL